MNTRPSTADEPLLLSAPELARLLGVSVRTVRTLDTLGRLPQPVRVGRAVRWSRQAVVEWIAGGCPRRTFANGGHHG